MRTSPSRWTGKVTLCTCGERIGQDHSQGLVQTNWQGGGQDGQDAHNGEEQHHELTQAPVQHRRILCAHCTYGTIADGSSSARSFHVPLSLLSLGQVSVTGTRTASVPDDPNPANDSDTATCTVVSIILATCP